MTKLWAAMGVRNRVMVLLVLAGAGLLVANMYQLQRIKQECERTIAVRNQVVGAIEENNQRMEAEAQPCHVDDQGVAWLMPGASCVLTAPKLDAGKAEPAGDKAPPSGADVQRQSEKAVYLPDAAGTI